LQPKSVRAAEPRSPRRDQGQNADTRTADKKAADKKAADKKAVVKGGWAEAVIMRVSRS
jgi:hypothetical protein